MSRTKHHFNNYKTSLLKIEKKELFPFYWKYFYNKTPKWFRRYRTHVRIRRKTKILLKKQMLNEQEDYVYPDKKKPINYWY